jgi:hypothetical protein
MAKLNINGSVRDVSVEADTPLLWVIREQIGLTGTKYGCGIAQCGAWSRSENQEFYTNHPTTEEGHLSGQRGSVRTFNRLQVSGDIEHQ